MLATLGWQAAGQIVSICVMLCCDSLFPILMQKRVTPISLNCHHKITLKFNQLCLKLEENTSIFSSTLLLPNEALYWPYLSFFNHIWPPYMTALFDFFLVLPCFVSFHLIGPRKASFVILRLHYLTSLFNCLIRQPYSIPLFILIHPCSMFTPPS